jgi:hypothetical protein
MTFRVSNSSGLHRRKFDYIKVKSSEALALIKTIHTFVYE